MSAYEPPLAEIGFLLNRVTGLEEVLACPPYAHLDAEVVVAVLEQAGRFTATVLGPLNASGDAEGSRLVDGRVVTPAGFRQAYQAFADGGWIGLDLPESHGGQQMPRAVQIAVAEMVNGACVSFGMLPLMQRAAAKVLIAHAEPWLASICVPRVVSGRWGATISMSEAQAGSDVGRARTRAEPRADGSYAITGTKIFITYGDQDLTENIVHVVLARTPGAPAGVKGLSLFAVPRLTFSKAGDIDAPNAVSISRVEEKMGLKASPTCVVDFDGAVGWRIGGEGEGLKNIFTMVNTMRLEVSVQGVAVAAAATRCAFAYAHERPQGGPPERPAVMIAEHPDVRRMLMTMRTRTDAMRALVYETARLLDLGEAHPDAKRRAEAQALAEWLLPVCKACGSETGFDVANLAVQVFGGHGYVKDAGVEQYVRDSRVMAIYEGANGIQAIDLVTRRLARDGGAAFRLFARRVTADMAAATGRSDLTGLAGGLGAALVAAERTSAWMIERLTTAPRDALAGATAYLQLIGAVATAWMSLRLALAAGPGTSEHDGKRASAAFHAAALLPLAQAHAAQATAGASTLDVLPGAGV